MHVSALSKLLVDGLTSQVDHVVRNGDPKGYPGCVNLSFAYVEGESLLMALKVGFLVLHRILLPEQNVTRKSRYHRGVLVHQHRLSPLMFFVHLVGFPLLL
jgi:hypothetical protein